MAAEVQVDTAAVAATVRRFAEISDSLAEMVRYGRADGFRPAQLGPLGAAAGASCADRVDALLTSLERSIAVIDGIGDAVTAAERALIETDADNAALITRAGER